LNLFCKNSLLTHFQNGIALISITARRNLDNLHSRTKAAQLIGNPIGLPQGELAPARADA
jgi:hypothetical protein